MFGVLIIARMFPKGKQPTSLKATFFIQWTGKCGRCTVYKKVALETVDLLRAVFLNNKNAKLRIGY